MMKRAAAAGLAYFTVVFALGFVLGVLRTVLLLPRVGELAAVAVELPVILILSWIICRRVVIRFAVPRSLSARLAMGEVAFALLMMGEVSVSVGLAGRSLAEHLALYGQTPQLLGLAGQVAFALFPSLQHLLDRPGEAPGRTRTNRHHTHR